VRIRERLFGVGLVCAGVAGIGLAYLFWRLGLGALPSVPLPPGMRPDLVPTMSPLSCVLPLIAIASTLLVLEGLRRIVFAE
jgi:hypothetical protein